MAKALDDLWTCGNCGKSRTVHKIAIQMHEFGVTDRSNCDVEVHAKTSVKQIVVNYTCGCTLTVNNPTLAAH